MHRKRKWKLLLGIALLVLVAPLARADSLSVTMDNANVTVAEGTVTVLQFFGTVTNPSLSDTLYLNSDALSGAFPNCYVIGFTGSCVDDSTVSLWPVFFQPSLPTMPTSANFDIFNVDLFGDLAPGTYNGVFSILGGADGGTYTAFDDLADINFSVTISSPTATPEPGTLVLLVSALSAAMLLGSRAKLING